MKRILALFACLAVVALEINPDLSKVVLSWTYPSAELTTNITFHVFHSTNAGQALTNWTWLTNCPGTQTQLLVRLPNPGGFHLLTIAVSNQWVLGPPAVPGLLQVPRSPGQPKIVQVP